MKKLALLILALTFALGLFAQHNEEVTIEGSYRPKVNKVDKILIKAETPKQSFEMPSTEVKVLDIEHRFPLELDRVSALNYNGKNAQTPEAAKNFLMAGFGSRISPVFLYKHNSNLTKNLALGVGVKHYSSWLDIKGYAPSSFMNNTFDFGLTSTKFNNLLLGGGLFYKYDMCHYYGIKVDDVPAGFSIETMAPQQTYNTVGATFNLTSTNTRNGEFVHDLGLNYHYLFDEVCAVQEHAARLDYDLGYVDSWWGSKEHPQKVGVALSTQAGRNYDGNERLIFKVNPYFEMKGAFYRLHLGVRMDGALDDETNNSLLTVHPDLKGSLLVLDNKLEFYAGLIGGRKLFTYRDLVEENPFVCSQMDMRVTTENLGFDGGVRAHVMPSVDIHVGVRYRQTENDLFYRQKIHALGGSYPYCGYTPLYDETRHVNVLAGLRWLVTDKLTMDAGFAYHNYQMTNESYPWYRPATEGNLKLDYRLDEHWNFNTSLLYQGGRYAQSYDNGPCEVVKMRDVFDLGLAADYRVNDQLGVFVKANNILHQKYQLYLDYPVKGIEFFAGLKMTF